MIIVYRFSRTKKIIGKSCATGIDYRSAYRDQEQSEKFFDSLCSLYTA